MGRLASSTGMRFGLGYGQAGNWNARAVRNIPFLFVRRNCSARATPLDRLCVQG